MVRLGSGLEAFSAAHPRTGRRRLGELYATWPFFPSLVDHARLAIRRADLPLARCYASLASEPGDDVRWAAIEREFERTRHALDQLPAAAPEDAPPSSHAGTLSAGLRAPYVDTLSVVQVELLRRFRQQETLDPDDPTLPVIRSLIDLTISGLSAALQGTG